MPGVTPGTASRAAELPEANAGLYDYVELSANVPSCTFTVEC